MSMNDTRVYEQVALTCMGAAGAMSSEITRESAMGGQSEQTSS